MGEGGIWENALFQATVPLSRLFLKGQKPRDHYFRSSFPGERHGTLWGQSCLESTFTDSSYLKRNRGSCIHYFSYCPDQIPNKGDLEKKYLFWLRVEESRVHHGREGRHGSGSVRLLVTLHPQSGNRFLLVLSSLSPFPLFVQSRTRVHWMGLPSPVTPLWKLPHS